ncbi:MAG: hypothetical protein IJF08_05330 [Clostridia bacterium]|nr:hypothetical protein [Clostridia bacterium]
MFHFEQIPAVIVFMWWKSGEMGIPTTAIAALVSKQSALKLAPLRSPSRSGEADLGIPICLFIRLDKVFHPFF